MLIDETTTDSTNGADPQMQHHLTQAQLMAIEHEIKSTQPLTSHLLPIDVLLQQYFPTNSGGNSTGNNSHSVSGDAHAAAQHPGYAEAATFLSTKYKSLRKVRGDGNCYYRAFLYSMCEHLLTSLIRDNHHAEFTRLNGVVNKSLKRVCQYGYEENTIEMFWEELVELFNFIKGAASTGYDDVDGGESKSASTCNKKFENALQSLHSKLNEENSTSDYCTWYMRVMAAAQMKSDPERYLPFVLAESYYDIPSFCSKEVEPMGRECGMVQVSALAEYMGVRVVIEYMDGRMTPGEGAKLANHVFGGGEVVENDGIASNTVDMPTITLLYRPGHYDILY